MERSRVVLVWLRLGRRPGLGRSLRLEWVGWRLPPWPSRRSPFRRRWPLWRRRTRWRSFRRRPFRRRWRSLWRRPFRRRWRSLWRRRSRRRRRPPLIDAAQEFSVLLKAAPRTAWEGGRRFGPSLLERRPDENPQRQRQHGGCARHSDGAWLQRDQGPVAGTERVARGHVRALHQDQELPLARLRSPFSRLPPAPR